MNLRRITTIGAICVLALIVILAGLGNAALQNRQYQSALLFPTSSGQAATQLASDYAADGQSDLVSNTAMRALNASLTHVEAMRALGIHRFSNGSEQADSAQTGKRLVELSGMLSWRDSQTQAWLFERSLIEGKFTNSIAHADALLRRRRAQDEIFSVFTLAALDPDLASSLRKQFAAVPDWRANFFAWANKTPTEQYRGFENIALGLQGSDAPVTREEVTPFTTMLINNGDAQRALQLWASLFPDNAPVLQADSTIRLDWPEDERLSTPYPVDWRFRPSRDIYPYIENSITEDEPVLELEMERRSSGEIARRTIIIPEGRVTLAIKGNSFADQPLQKLSWSLRCNDGEEGEPIALKQRRRDALRWTALVNDDCAVHDLVMSVIPGGLTVPTLARMGSIRLTHETASVASASDEDIKTASSADMKPGEEAMSVNEAESE